MMRMPKKIPRKIVIEICWLSMLLRYGPGVMIKALFGETREWTPESGLMVKRMDPPKMTDDEKTSAGFDKHGIPVERDDEESLNNAQLSLCSARIDYDPIVDLLRGIVSLIPLHKWFGLKKPNAAGTIVLAYQTDLVIMDGVKHPNEVLKLLKHVAKMAASQEQIRNLVQQAHITGSIQAEYTAEAVKVGMLGAIREQERRGRSRPRKESSAQSSSRRLSSGGKRK